MSGTPLTDAINALTTYANEITGQSDTTLSDAVESLVDGYGGGGSSLPSSVLAHVEVTPTENITPSNKLSITLAPVTGAYMLVYYCESNLTAPSDGTIGWIGYSGKCLSLASSGVVLRANGTQGSDGNAITGFDETTGILSFPRSQYSLLVAGNTYHFWLFKVGDYSS